MYINSQTTHHCLPQRATWHVPPEQWNPVERRAARTSTAPSQPPPSPPRPHRSSRSPLTPIRPRLIIPPSGGRHGRCRAEGHSEGEGQGSEESVLSEMQVLQGLDHRNVVRP